MRRSSDTSQVTVEFNFGLACSIITLTLNKAIHTFFIPFRYKSAKSQKTPVMTRTVIRRRNCRLRNRPNTKAVIMLYAAFYRDFWDELWDFLNLFKLNILYSAE